MIDWKATLIFIGCVAASFAMGWGAAVLQDIVGVKALASGLIPAGAYILGKSQEKPDFKV